MPLSWIRTHDLSLRAFQDPMGLRPRGHWDWYLRYWQQQQKTWTELWKEWDGVGGGRTVIEPAPAQLHSP